MYEKINFINGQTLKAEELNHMEDGIAKANSIIETQGGDTLTWDGNTEGLTSAVGLYFKVSRATPTAADMASGTITAVVEGKNISDEFDSSALTETQSGVLAVLDGMIMIVPEGSVGIDIGIGIIFPEAGTYFASNEVAQITSITIPGYTGFTTEKITPSHLYQPDWNQNDPNAPDYIKNKTHAEQHSWSDTLTWDGDETGRTVVVINDDEFVCDRLVHVSDVVPSMDNLANGIFCVLTYQNGTTLAWEAGPEYFIEGNGVLATEYIWIASEENGMLYESSVPLPKKGIYMYAVTDKMGSLYSRYCSSITIPGYNFADPTDPITPEMISAAPSYHASESIKHGIGTDKKYGHLKLANFDDVFTSGLDNILDINIELPTGDPSIDLRPYAFGASVGWSVSNFLGECINENYEILDYHETQIRDLQNQTLKQTDRQSIINDALNALAGGENGLPEVTVADAGKFMRVSSAGKWAAEAIPNAEEAMF